MTMHDSRWLENVIIEAIDTDDTVNSNNNSKNNYQPLLKGIANGLNRFAFMKHNQIEIIAPEQGNQMQCRTQMANHLIGNRHYGMLHGGAIATILENAGVAQTMANVAIKSLENNVAIEDVVKHIAHTKTLSFSIDYLKPGLGESFIATCNIIRLGRKSCMTRLQLVNEQGTTIAIASATYVY